MSCQHFCETFPEQKFNHVYSIADDNTLITTPGEADVEVVFL